MDKVISLILIVILAYFTVNILDSFKPPKRVELTEYEKKLFFCMTDGFASGSAVYNFPEKPYVMWKKKIVYLDKTKCERKCK